MNKLAPVAPMQLLVSTDLDGTLLDHDTYDWLPAKPGMEQLKRVNAPIIINTSKTFDEVVKLQGELSLHEPFVVENGSALFLPKSQYPRPDAPHDELTNHWQVLFGAKRSTIVSELATTRENQGYRFESFSDMSLEQLIAHTGLPPENATLAMKRQFSEPLIWKDSEVRYNEFKAALETKNFKVIKGGRFTHILGETNKGVAILWFKAFYEKLNQTPAAIIALGDSQNDIDMLNIADYAVAIRSPAHDFPEFSTQGITINTNEYGPAGWTEAINTIIQNTK